MSYSNNGVRSVDAGSLSRGDSIECIDGAPPRYRWCEIISVEPHPAHPNRVKLTLTGGRVVLYPKNQRVRYKRAEANARR